MKQSDKIKTNLENKKVLEPFELDGDVKAIELKHIEKLNLKRVYDELVQLELEMSSDEESTKKKYLKEIESKANFKKMNPSSFTNKNNLMSKSDKNRVTSTECSNQDTFNNNQSKKEIKISLKSLRKILRKLTNFDKVPSEEIDQMIWEVDEDNDGLVSKYEFEKMYKRCINDTEELEPKRLFYLVKFLMYDKDNKYFITEEDTLELLYIRHGDKFNKSIEDIFQIELKDPETGTIKKVIKEKVYYDEYFQRMINIALKKRANVKDRRTNYCSYINQDK